MFGQELTNLVCYCMLTWKFVLFYDKINLILHHITTILPPSLGKTESIVFGIAIITSLLPLMITPIVMTTWLNFCKAFWLFYRVDKIVTLLAWFRFFSLYELFPAFICAYNTVNLVNSLFVVFIFLKMSAAFWMSV